MLEKLPEAIGQALHGVRPASTKSPSTPWACARAWPRSRWAAWPSSTMRHAAALHGRRRRRVAAAAMDRCRPDRHRWCWWWRMPIRRRRIRWSMRSWSGSGGGRQPAGGRVPQRRQRGSGLHAGPQFLPSGRLAAARSAARPRRAPLRVPGLRAGQRPRSRRRRAATRCWSSCAAHAVGERPVDRHLRAARRLDQDRGRRAGAARRSRVDR